MKINVELHFNIHQLQHPSKIIQTSIQHLFTIHFNIYLPSIHQAERPAIFLRPPGGLFRQLGGSTGFAGHWIFMGFSGDFNQQQQPPQQQQQQQQQEREQDTFTLFVHYLSYKPSVSSTHQPRLAARNPSKGCSWFINGMTYPNEILKMHGSGPK